MPIHSSFLIHWTGKKQLTQASRANREEKVRLYVDLLRDIMCDGFLMNAGQETLHRRGGLRLEVHQLPYLCFSEVKVSQVKLHRKQYGSLGIGVSRDFVRARSGGPVLYVPGGKRGLVIRGLADLQTIMRKYPPPEGKCESSIDVIAAFCKELPPNDRKLPVYDEMEWRVVCTNKKGKHYRVGGEGTIEKIYLKLQPGDIKVVVFPDKHVREKAFKDDCIAGLLAQVRIQMLADACAHF